MEVIISPTPEAASEIAARVVARQVREKPSAVLGLATGETPRLLYELLIRMQGEGIADFSHVTTFNLDEYVGLHPKHPASYYHYMQRNFFEHLPIAPRSIHIPDGLTPDIPAHCAAYEAAIRSAGGIDLQILGLGTDGHLGFNEPGSSLASRTRIKTLTEQTRRDNAAAFPACESVPNHVITMGLGTIMESRVCLLLAFGRAKAEAAALCVEGPVTASVPGSILQFHQHAKVLLDEEAASRLVRRDYYEWVYKSKPGWQKDT